MVVKVKGQVFGFRLPELLFDTDRDALVIKDLANFSELGEDFMGEPALTIGAIQCLHHLSAPRFNPIEGNW